MDVNDPLKIDFFDQRVVVLGGGDTAMNVRTAIRQKAKFVKAFVEETKKICLVLQRK